LARKMPTALEELRTEARNFSSNGQSCFSLSSPKKILNRLLAPEFVVGALAPEFVVGALAPEFVVGALAPEFVVGALAPEFVVGALAPEFVVGALAPTFCLYGEIIFTLLPNSENRLSHSTQKRLLSENRSESLNLKTPSTSP
jgi:hypothetical protein